MRYVELSPAGTGDHHLLDTGALLRSEHVRPQVVTIPLNAISDDRDVAVALQFPDRGRDSVLAESETFCYPALPDRCYCSLTNAPGEFRIHAPG